MAEIVVDIIVGQLLEGAVEWMKNEISLLKGVKSEIDNMTTKMQEIQKVLEDAQNQRVKKPNVKTWVERLQDVSYEMDDVLDEWSTKIHMQNRERTKNISLFEMISCSSSPTNSKFSFSSFKQFNCFSSAKQLSWRHDIASRVKTINGTMNSVFDNMATFGFVEKTIQNHGLHEIINPNVIDRITTSFVDESKVFGRDVDKDFLVSKVLSMNMEEQKSLQVISVVGPGGLGKTTLAQLVYNDEKGKEKFGECRIWVCVSNPFNEVKVAKGILEALKVDHTKMEHLQTLLQSINESLSKNKFLLVLDDIWNEDFRKWEQLSTCLKCGDPESRILVTTRKKEVATIMGTLLSNMLKPKLISHEDCWLLTRQIAFQGQHKENAHELEDTGKEIAKKCQGLPLAAKTLGGLLILKDSVEEWINVLDSERYGSWRK